VSYTVQDHYTDDDFESLLDDAEGNAANDWEAGFVSDMKARFQMYGKRMYISAAQREHLERIADDEG
jgi:hypothetical protein